MDITRLTTWEMRRILLDEGVFKGVAIADPGCLPCAGMPATATNTKIAGPHSNRPETPCLAQMGLRAGRSRTT